MTARPSSNPVITTPIPFFPCNLKGQRLFSVAPGIPVIDALEAVSCILKEITVNPSEESPCRSVHLEACRAVIDSVVQTLMEETRKGGEA
jgi:hypothetical protein